MKELIKIESREIGDSVSVRDLYIGLGLSLAHWSKWSKLNIDKNEFFIEGHDWQGFTLKVNGNETKDYAVSLEFAKHIAMQARTNKSHLYRQYMIECENKNKEIALLPDFNDPIAAARAWADTKESEQKALQIIKHQQQSLTNKDQLIMASNEASIKAGEILVREFVKSNDLIDLGEKQFYEWMRENGYILKGSCEPSQKYVKLGYFTWKPTAEQHGGKFRYTLRITPRGKVWLAGKYLAYLDNDITA